MFKFSKTYEVDRSTLKCDFVLFSPASMNRKDTANNQNFIDMTIEDNAIPSKNKFLD